MVHAYIMVDTGAGMSPEVLQHLLEFEGVAEAHIVAGEWDIVVEIDAEKVYDILKTVSSDIGNLDGVGTTRTYIVLE